MAVVNVRVVEGGFTEDHKRTMTAPRTDVMVEYLGSETFRAGVWILVQEPSSAAGDSVALPSAIADVPMDALGAAARKPDTAIPGRCRDERIRWRPWVTAR
jgi:phenylpyruvate tautomerase PptA (4-oxalocrotonate tautomerase family)